MNIRVDLNYPIKDGTEVVFRSPVDCSQVTGLKVYFPGGSQEFAFADAHGNNVGDIDHLFAENVAVKVILDVTTGMAFVQNADTNAYLEGRFAETIEKCCVSFEESGAIVACDPVEGYPLEVVTRIESPQSSATLWRGGKNMLPFPYTHDDADTKEWSDNGVTRTINDDGSVTVRGTATETIYQPRFVKLQTGLEGVSWGQYTYYDKGNGIMCVLLGKGTTVDTTIYPQLEYGSVSTEYEPYRGEFFHVDFGQTVESGSFNWKTGVLTVDGSAEPIQLPPQQILALSGRNTLYSDTGDTTVTGRTDPTAVIEKLTNAIIALGGNV